MDGRAGVQGTALLRAKTPRKGEDQVEEAFDGGGVQVTDLLHGELAVRSWAFLRSATSVVQVADLLWGRRRGVQVTDLLHGGVQVRRTCSR